MVKPESTLPETTQLQTPFRRPGFAERRIRKMLTGTMVEIDGSNPWDLQIHNPKFFKRVLLNGSIGLGESYVDGWWDSKQLDEMYNRLLRSPRIRQQKFLTHALTSILPLCVNLQSRARAFRVGKAHYDIGNDIYEAMLDKRMLYTCGYWRNADNLDDAQQHKLKLVCRKLNLQPGMRVLDIGCGWGGFAKYAAENHGVEVVGVTISKKQIEFGIALCHGLPVELRLQDYRDINEKFDAIVSLGMFEHVGQKNHRAYMQVVHRCLKDEGKFLLQTIGKNDSRIRTDLWISKYIFPNGEIPSLKQISSSLESLMMIEDVHNFGADYDKTLIAWFANFHRNWPRLSKNLPPQFYRKWKYYLHMCAGVFRARDLQLWQIVISTGHDEGGYQRPDM